MYEGKRVRLRAFEAEDLDANHAFVNDYETLRGMMSGIPLPAGASAAASANCPIGTIRGWIPRSLAPYCASARLSVVQPFPPAPENTPTIRQRSPRGRKICRCIRAEHSPRIFPIISRAG